MRHASRSETKCASSAGANCGVTSRSGLTGLFGGNGRPKIRPARATAPSARCCPDRLGRWRLQHGGQADPPSFRPVANSPILAPGLPTGIAPRKRWHCFNLVDTGIRSLSTGRLFQVPWHPVSTGLMTLGTTGPSLPATSLTKINESETVPKRCSRRRLATGGVRVSLVMSRRGCGIAVRQTERNCHCNERSCGKLQGAA